MGWRRRKSSTFHAAVHSLAVCSLTHFQYLISPACPLDGHPALDIPEPRCAPHQAASAPSLSSLALCPAQQLSPAFALSIASPDLAPARPAYRSSEHPPRAGRTGRGSAATGLQGDHDSILYLDRECVWNVRWWARRALGGPDRVGCRRVGNARWGPVGNGQMGEGAEAVLAGLGAGRGRA